MERELPEIEIAGTIFQFDIDRITLVEKSNPKNEIDFNFMEDHGTHYSFDYSAVSKNYHFVQTEETLQELKDNVKPEERIYNPPIRIEIPRIGVLDPQGMCEKYGCTLNDIEQKIDFEIMVNQQAFHDRLEGWPVTIDLAGKIYEVNVKNNLLHPRDGTGDEILFSKYHYDYFLEDKGVYQLYYNTKENKVIDYLSEGASALTNDCVILHIPDLNRLDPIGVLEKNGFDSLMPLFYSDIKLDHTAELVPFEAFELMEVEIDKVTYETSFNKEGKEVEKPLITIARTDFIVDIDKFEFRQKENENNVIRFDEMDDYKSGYGFYYNLKSKNIPGKDDPHELWVGLPKLIELVPQEIATKYDKSIEEVGIKTDFEIFIDQDVLDRRIIRKELPILEIAGHPFYVDLQMDKLRPKNDFHSKGISFAEIADFYDNEKQKYFVPYHTNKHEVEKIDLEAITEIPKELIVVSFPHQSVLDPIGSNTQKGFVQTFNLLFKELKMHFKALPGKWEDIGLPHGIKDNVLDRGNKEKTSMNRSNWNAPMKGKGRKF